MNVKLLLVVVLVIIVFFMFIGKYALLGILTFVLGYYMGYKKAKYPIEKDVKTWESEKNTYDSD